MESNISRDHIALEAMKLFYYANIGHTQTLWNKICVLFGGELRRQIIHPVPDKMAKWAYEYADAMIAERERKEESVNAS